MDILKNRTIRKQILLTEEDNLKLQQVAALQGISQNEVVNKSLHAYLARFNKKLPKEA